MSNDPMQFFNSSKVEPYTSNQSKVYDPIPTGEYNVTFLTHTIDLTGLEPKVSLTYVIHNEPFTRRRIFANYTLGEKGAPIFKKALSELGVKVDEIKSLDDIGTKLTSLWQTDYKVKAIQRQYPKKDGTTGYAHNIYVNGVLNGLKQKVEPNFDEPMPF